MEDPNSEVMIGNVQVYLQSLAYMIEMNEQLDIVDYKGQAVGHLNVAVSKNQQQVSIQVNRGPMVLQVYSQSLAYMREMNEQLDVVDYKGQAVGHLNVAVSQWYSHCFDG